MPTERIYYTDPTVLEFEGRVISTGRQGEKFLTVLDRSAFYPTSGGQPHDTGRLGDTDIIEVAENDAGDVVHITVSETAQIGASVRGVVDKTRRWKNRQMHTAQHILSQTFIKLYQLETMSVHLGEDYGAVELNTGEVSLAQLDEAERYAGEIISDNLPVDILFVASDEAARLPLRKIPDREGTIRVIRIGQFDWSACGGTHCQRTAEVGVLKLVGAEKMRGRVLVKFLSGVQAVSDYGQRFQATNVLSRNLSCGIADLAPKIDKLQAENRELRRQSVELLKELTPIRAEAISQKVDRSGSTPVVVDAYSDAETAAQLASEVARRIRGLAVICAEGKLLFAVDESSQLHAGNLAREFATRSGLRGGGGPKAAQVGGADTDKLDDYRVVIREIVAHV